MKTNYIANIIGLLVFALGGQNANAFNEMAQTFTLDGQLFSNTGMTVPLLDATATLNIQILNPSGTCILYEETQVVNTLTTNGYFNVHVGSATGSGKRTGADSNSTMARVYQNWSAIPGVSAPAQVCTGGTYTPLPGDARAFRLTVTPTAGAPETLSPDMVLDAVPMALIAQSVQGLERANILQVNTTAPADLSQTTLESIFNTTQLPKLLSLVNGSSSQYVTVGTTTGVGMPSYTTGSPPTSPTAGSMWYDSTAGAMKYYDGSTTKTVGSGTVVGSTLTNGQIWVGNGSSQAASVAVSGDGTLSNTGVLTLGTGFLKNGGNAVGATLTAGTTDTQDLGLKTNNLTRMTIDSTGKVGIGIATPGAILDVRDPGVAATTEYLMIRGQSSSVKGIGLGFSTDGAGAAKDGRIRAIGSVPLVLGTTNQTQALNILDTNGNVGIGSTAPTVSLDLNTRTDGIRLPSGTTAQQPGTPANGMIRYNTTDGKFEFYQAGAWINYGTGSGSGDFLKNGTIAMTGNFNAGGNSILGNTTASANLSLESTSNGTKGHVLIQPNGGNVGIGTTSALAALHVYRDANASSTIVSENPNVGSSAYAGLQLKTDGGSSYIYRTSVAYGSGLGNSTVFQDAGGGDLVFSGAAVNMTIKNGGNVGIGTTTPSVSLDFNTRTDGIRLPAGTTAQQPGTPANGMIRYNTTDGKFEFYQAGAWTNYGTGSGNGDFLRNGTLAMTGNFNAGGNSILGNTTASANLTLESTSNATKGYVILQPTSGNVGIGTATPGATLDVNGQFDNSGNAYIGKGVAQNVELDANGGAPGGHIAFKNSGTNILYIPTGGAANAGNVGIGTNNPVVSLDFNTRTDGIRLPSGTTAQQPGTPANGMIRYNTTDNKFEFYQAGAWTNYGTGSGSGDFKADGTVAMTGVFQATNGSNTLPSITFASNPNTGIYRSAADTISLTAGGIEGLRVNTLASGVNYVALTPAATGNSPKIASAGADTNVALDINSKGAANIRFNTGGGNQMRVIDAASAVNYVQVIGAATGATVGMSAQGTDTNVSIGVSAKGTGSVYLSTTNGASFGALDGGASTVNYITAKGSAAGSGTTLGTAGTDTNINLSIMPKGTGNVGIGTTTPAVSLDFNTRTDGVRLPAGTTAQQPASPANGMIRYNTTDGKFEFYQAGAWVNYGTGSGSGDFLKNGTIAMTGNFNAGGNSVLGNTTASANLSLESTSNATKGFVILQPNGGNVGIGTASPSTKLYVMGDGAFESNSQYYGVQVGNSTNVIAKLSGNDSGNENGMLDLSNTGTVRTKIIASGSSYFNGGNVGIGTTTPGAPLQVALTSGSFSPSLILQNAHAGLIQDLGTYINFRASSSNIASVGAAWSNNADSNNAYLNFQTRSAGTMTEQMRIAATGNVGIGTTTPAVSLDFNTRTDGIRLPAGTTAQQPGTPANGMIRYNTTDSKFEFYQAGAWINYGTGSGSGDFLKDGSIPMTGSLKMGGNTINGSAASSGNLTLDSTSHATKGFVLLNPTSGKVGVGTTSPETLMDVRGVLSIGNSATGIANPNAVMVVRAPNTSNPHIILEKSGVNTGGFAVDSSNFIMASELADITFRTGVNYNGDYSSTGTEIMRIKNSNGNVGIGTNNPSVSLDFNTRTDGIRLPAGTTAQQPGTPANGMIRYNTTDSKFEFYQGGAWVNYGSGTGNGDFLKNGTVAMTGNFNAGGNSILGNTTASANLTLESTSNATKGYVILQPTSGNVGIGTTTPGEALHVVRSSGSAFVIAQATGGAGSAGFNASSAASNNTYNGFFSGGAAAGSRQKYIGNLGGNLSFGRANDAWASNIEQMVILNNGNVGIGTSTPTTGAILDLYGTGAASSSMMIPRDTTANRPATGVNGMIRYNSSVNQVEGYVNSRWATLIDGRSSAATGSLIAGPADTASGSGIAGATNAGARTTVYGASAFSSANSNTDNTAIGYLALAANSGGWTNTAVGSYALASNTTGSSNVAVGTNAGGNMGPNGSYSGNTIVGDYDSTGMAIIAGADNNTIIGRSSAANLTSGAHNIVIGQGINVPTATGSNQLNIGNLIFGTGMSGTGSTIAGSVGIGTATPARLLHVNGPMRMTAAALPGSPAAGDLAIDSGDSNVLKFHNGTAWQTVSAFITSCPTGFTMIGTAGKRGTYCISTTGQTATNYFAATSACEDLAVSDGSHARMCDFNQWHKACRAGTPTSMTGHWEWTSFLFDSNVALSAGNAGCNDTDNNLTTNNYVYRCCID